MLFSERVEKLSDEFQSTFTVIRMNPTVIANMMAPHEVDGVKEMIQRHIGWASVDAVSTGQLTPDYDIYYFAEGKTPTAPGERREGE